MLSTALNFIKKKMAAGKRPLDTVQVEITSRCNAACRMCPRGALPGWKSGDMNLALFRKVSDLIRQARHVHLQGWGEPLLHPDLLAMLKIAKDLQARVGLTTNGQLLGPETAETLIKGGIDVIAVSLAGADAKTHGQIRTGTDFRHIITNILSLKRLKAELGLDRPSVVISFLMLRQNVRQLPGVIGLAAELGADRVSATNLDLVWDAETDGMRAFQDLGSRAARYDDLVNKARKAASSAGIDLRLYPLIPDEQPVCEANPLKNLFVSFDGCLAPCPYLGLPAAKIPRYFMGRTTSCPRLCFGNIMEGTFSETWNSRPYAEFRQQFAGRLSVTASLYDQISCDFEVLEKAQELDQAYTARLKEMKPPRSCQGCWKLYGV
jgi:MoaA/NifB/PqqE/SkfB family radical SAM enzyme